MPETYNPAGGVGTGITRPTTGEATGTGGQMLRTNVTTLANKARFLNDDGTIAGEAWVAPTLINAFAQVTAPDATYTMGFPPVGYSKFRDGLVQLRGCVSGGGGLIAFVLPLGYRPAGTVVFLCPSPSAPAQPILVSVDPSGNVLICRADGGSATAAPVLAAVAFRAA